MLTITKRRCVDTISRKEILLTTIHFSVGLDFPWDILTTGKYIFRYVLLEWFDLAQILQYLT